MEQSIKEASRMNYLVPENGATLEQVKVGLLQRMADATEAMAKEHNELLRQKDLYFRWYQEGREKMASLQKTVSNLRGQITKLKNKQNKIAPTWESSSNDDNELPS